ncbi:hypothetical protein [Haloferula sargassicola]|uniref:DUF3592 domain-containing protein n=1 Tax=Haloferula sargassicola TaxID=490096 RepID=A0ABP9UKY2_9BACT
MSDAIVCKPTPWFLLRAVAMLLMFGIFAAMFFKDGKWGYRDQNLAWYTWKGFEEASQEFSAKQGDVSPAEWREYAAGREITLPEDRSILPVGTPERLEWPEILGDYEAMKAGAENPRTMLFDPYREKVGMKAKVPEHDFIAQKIFEQWVVFWICLVLALGALFVLIRTLGRSLKLENGTLFPPGGKPVALSDLKRIDLRRWQNKGLAFAWADAPGGGERKIRIDGLTYGGFKTEDDQPAEKLMQAVLAGFSGEVIDYEKPAESEPEAPEQAKAGRE